MKKRPNALGLLHDIGKAVDHEIEGPHAIIGADLAKKARRIQGNHPLHRRTHHEDTPPMSILANLVQAADSLSGARPGARKELLENYVKRLEELEGLATGFDGCAKSLRHPGRSRNPRHGRFRKGWRREHIRPL